MDLGIKGELALVVGASEGIGYECARGLLEEGARVRICSRNPAKLLRAATQLEQSSGTPVPWRDADITQPEQVDRLKHWMEEASVPLHILVIAVGGSQRALFEELDDAAWFANYEFNILGTVRVVRALLPLMKQAQGARIVILGAAGARMPYPHQVVSNVHKAGVIALVKTLGTELLKYGVRVNSVSPGRTLTSLWTTRAQKLALERGISPQDVIGEFSREIPMGRFGKPEEIAAMVVFLASHKASYVTGQSVLVDGGIARGLI